MAKIAAKRGYSLIVARDLNDLIGVGDTIPWHCKEDLKHFKEQTKGKKLIVGRATYDSLPNVVKNDNDRTFYVVTRSKDRVSNGNTYYGTLKQALIKTQYAFREEVMVIGGAQIYTAMLPYLTRAIVSEMKMQVSEDKIKDLFIESMRDRIDPIKVKSMDEMKENERILKWAIDNRTFPTTIYDIDFYLRGFNLVKMDDREEFTIMEWERCV